MISVSEYYLSTESATTLFENGAAKRLLEGLLAATPPRHKIVAFSDALDERVLRAARILHDQHRMVPLLPGNPSQIRDLAGQCGIHTRGLRIRHPRHDPNFEALVKEYGQLNKKRGLTRFEAEQQLLNPLVYGAMLVRKKLVDVCLIGNRTSTAQALRCALQVIGPKPQTQTVSSFWLAFPEDGDRIWAFADGMVNPRPDAAQLAEIALTTAHNYRKLTGQEPRVAMLSFSTNKSAEHEMAVKVRQAVHIARQKKEGLIVDGEVQFDAAIVPEVARQKAPRCQLQGMANVFIFPSLNAGNAASHILRHLCGLTVLGPFLQGLNGPMQVLPPDCSSAEMINIALIALNM